MTGERQPRMAAAALKEMFATSAPGRFVPAAAVAMLVLLAAGGWGIAKRRSRDLASGPS